MRWAAIHASARMGLPMLAECLRTAATTANSEVPEAIAFLGALGIPSDMSVLQDLLAKGRAREAALAALGAMGRADCVPILLEHMKDPDTASSALMALTRIVCPPDIGPRGGQEAEPSAGSAGSQRDHERLARWWKDASGRFANDVRYQDAIALPPTAQIALLERLTLRSMRDAYLALAAVDVPGLPAVELEARTTAGRDRSLTAVDQAKGSAAVPCSRVLELNCKCRCESAGRAHRNRPHPCQSDERNRGKVRGFRGTRVALRKGSGPVSPSLHGLVEGPSVRGRWTRLASNR